MRLLSISDEVERMLQTSALESRVGAVNAILNCGDLPVSYLEYLVTMLNVPCFYIHGNHDAPEQRADGTIRTEPQGCDDLDLQIVNLRGLLAPESAGWCAIVRDRINIPRASGNAACGCWQYARW